MAVYREIVTKAVIGKGKKQFIDNLSLKTANQPTTVLGCWVINHNFSGNKVGNRVVINGSYDINIWYSYDDDTKTEVLKQNHAYQETIMIQGNDNDISNEEIIVRSLSGPSCSKAEIVGDSIKCTVEKVLGIELVGDTKVRIAVDNEENETWEDILDSDDKIDEAIDNEVNEEYLEERETNIDSSLEEQNNNQ